MKHHYIPKFYLKEWLGDDQKLLEFRRMTNPHTLAKRLEIKRRGVNETGFEENLYTLPGTSKETRDNVEKIFMGAVDAKAALARDQLLQGIIPQGELRHAWARFLLSLMLRTPEQIRSFKAVMRLHWESPDAEIQARYELERQPDWPATLEEWVKTINPKSVERSAILVATNLIQRESTLNLFMSATWWILDCSTVQRRLMTSDHPIFMTNGLGRADGHFGLPISPTKLFAGFMTQEVSEKIRAMPIGRTVRNVNDAVIGQGRRSVNSVDDSNAALVKQRMGKRDYFAPLPNSMVKARARDQRKQNSICRDLVTGERTELTATRSLG